jgi:hypothetical protein
MVVTKMQPAGSGCRHGDPVEARRQRVDGGGYRGGTVPAARRPCKGAGATELIGEGEKRRGADSVVERGWRNRCPVSGDAGAAAWMGEGGGGVEGREEAAASYV